MTGIAERIAAAPISWGVWEANGATGWTVPADTYLAQVRALGLTATEFGPDGYLPIEPAARKAKLDEYGLRALGAFVPVMLFRDDVDPLPAIEKELDAYVVAGASTIIYAASSGGQGYDDRPVLTVGQWTTFFANLDRLVAAARDRGITPTLHHHMGTIIQTAHEVERLFEHSDIGLCLDTGHMLISGTAPIEIAQAYADRINFCHLKDVDGAVAARVRTGEVSYMDALGRGIFKPLGQGDVRIADLVRTLEDNGYQGWYVMEQDAVLADESELDGALADVRASLDFLRRLPAQVD